MFYNTTTLVSFFLIVLTDHRIQHKHRWSTCPPKGKILQVTEENSYIPAVDCGVQLYLSQWSWTGLQPSLTILREKALLPFLPQLLQLLQVLQLLLVLQVLQLVHLVQPPLPLLQPTRKYSSDSTLKEPVISLLLLRLLDFFCLVKETVTKDSIFKMQIRRLPALRSRRFWNDS